MYLAGVKVGLEDIDTGLLALFPNDGPAPFRDLTTQHFMAILGDPDDVEMDGKCGRGAMAIVTHALQSTQNRLKLPPKGGGFAHLRVLNASAPMQPHVPSCYLTLPVGVCTGSLCQPGARGCFLMHPAPWTAT